VQEPGLVESGERAQDPKGNSDCLRLRKVTFGIETIGERKGPVRIRRVRSSNLICQWVDHPESRVVAVNVLRPEQMLI
jgi:hypothetical protein